MKLPTSLPKLKSKLLVRRVAGDSMLPTLKPGQLILAVGFGAPKCGEVVIVFHQGLEKIKRVTRQTADQLFVEGDNAAKSTDSRHFGWLSRTSVVARVVWPRIKHII